MLSTRVRDQHARAYVYRTVKGGTRDTSEYKNACINNNTESNETETNVKRYYECREIVQVRLKYAVYNREELTSVISRRV